jgi:hypothetical protein
MLKLSHKTRNAALGALLVAGLAGSAVVTIAPVAAQAQRYGYGDRDYDYHHDMDNRYYHRDWDDRYRGDRDRYYDRDYNRGWVGIGVPGFGVGFYDQPYYNGYGPYCSAYDYDNGFCSY